MNRFGEFLRKQITLDLEVLKLLRERTESGTSDCSHTHIVRGFRECELKARLLGIHEQCGTGGGPCDELGHAYHVTDERGCATRAVLGLPYIDRPGYRPWWRP